MRRGTPTLVHLGLIEYWYTLVGRTGGLVHRGLVNDLWLSWLLLLLARRLLRGHHPHAGGEALCRIVTLGCGSSSTLLRVGGIHDASGRLD